MTDLGGTSGETITITIDADDDLLIRAEKIVHALGFRGEVGGLVIRVWRILQAYEKADTSP